MTTDNLFTRHVAEQAGHDLIMVRKTDAEALIAVLRELTAEWKDGYMWEEYSQVHCRYCGVEAPEHPYAWAKDKVEVEHATDCVIARAEVLLARMEGGS